MIDSLLYKGWATFICKRKLTKCWSALGLNLRFNNSCLIHTKEILKYFPEPHEESLRYGNTPALSIITQAEGSTTGQCGLNSTVIYGSILSQICPSCELHVFHLIINRFHLDTVSLMINICFFFYPCPFGFKYSKQEQVMTYNVTVQRKTYEEIYLSIE